MLGEPACKQGRRQDPARSRATIAAKRPPTQLQPSDIGDLSTGDRLRVTKTAV